jgi:hypothetical protein
MQRLEEVKELINPSSQKHCMSEVDKAAKSYLHICRNMLAFTRDMFDNSLSCGRLSQAPHGIGEELPESFR